MASVARQLLFVLVVLTFGAVGDRFAMAQTVPGATTVIAPSGAGQSPTPTFRWTAVAGVTWYLLWVDDSTGTRINQWYTSAAANCTGGTGECSVSPSTVLSEGAVTTWVQTWNNAGYGPWSAGLASRVGSGVPAPPGAVTLLTPIGAGQSSTPTYSWAAVANSTWYFLYVDDTTGARIRSWYRDTELGCGGGTGICSITPQTTLSPGAVETWVQSWNDSGAGPWSELASSSVSGSNTDCSAASAPGPVSTSLVTSGSPVQVPANFMGMHRGLHVPAHLPDAYGTVPAPTYPYGYARNLKAEVDGGYESGFWSSIELTAGVYSWTKIDKWVEATGGRPIIWLIYGTPTFYQKYPNEPSLWPSWPGIASPPTNAGHVALKNFAQAVKARYGSQIVAFELWNEPTFPWTSGPTSYNDRWTPAWAAANGQGAPFFSGSATDLANIAFTLDSANLGVPILGGGFVDSWSSDAHSITRFLNAPVTLPGGSGKGKNHIQALSTHFYDYSFTPQSIVSQALGYRAKIAAAGLAGMPIWVTEAGAESGGVFSANDGRAPVNVHRWVLLGAATAMKSFVLYGHFAGIGSVQNLGDPINNASLIASLTQVNAIGGQTICQAAVLNDGRVWVETIEGQTFIQ